MFCAAVASAGSGKVRGEEVRICLLWLVLVLVLTDGVLSFDLSKRSYSTYSRRSTYCTRGVGDSVL
jgi:hypothetical protein